MRTKSAGKGSVTMQGLCYYRPLAEETEAEVCLANEQLVSFDSNLSALASPISTGQGPGCQKSPWGARPPAVQSPCIYRPSVHLPHSPTPRQYVPGCLLWSLVNMHGVPSAMHRVGWDARSWAVQVSERLRMAPMASVCLCASSEALM